MFKQTILVKNKYMIKILQKWFGIAEQKRPTDIRTNRLLRMNSKLSLKRSKL